MQDKKMRYIVFLGFLITYACSPIKTSSKDEKALMELSLHEVQANVDELRHDLSCFQTDLRIVEGKVRNQENQLDGVKQKQIAQTLNKIDLIFEKLKDTELHIAKLESRQKAEDLDLELLSGSYKEVVMALSQYKDKLLELEKNLVLQGKHQAEIEGLKSSLEGIIVSLKGESSLFYKVKAGDSLDKIARLNKTTVEKLKRANNLEQDLIAIGQELKIPK